ncbi:MAG: trypsin-like serine protease [Labilithrix sp.]|nr:trypsin-like serine protease [Labilithrix sp.]
MWVHVTPKRSRLALAAALFAVGCATPAPPDDDAAASESAVIGEQQDGPPTDLPEVVQVLVDNRAQDYCTGVLVSPTRVLTAAHCMGGATFLVRAPHAPGADGRPQESKARKAGSVTSSRSYIAEVWKEDAATLDLETPIRLETYATVEDVGELDEETTLRAVAVGRSAESRDAPLVKSKELAVKSGAPLGYTTGLVSQYYSSGGDSGGPLFLVDEETGEPTHVVIGVERQPDPPREFFTRITPAVKRLVEAPRR